MTRDEIKSNLRDSINKIKNLIYLSDPNLFGLPETSLEDLDVVSGRLEMVLINFKFLIYSEQDLTEVLSTLTEFKEKLFAVLYKISIDSQGNLKPKSKAELFLVGCLVGNISYTHRDDHITIDVDMMFSS